MCVTRGLLFQAPTWQCLTRGSCSIELRAMAKLPRALIPLPPLWQCCPLRVRIHLVCRVPWPYSSLQIKLGKFSQPGRVEFRFCTSRIVDVDVVAVSLVGRSMSELMFQMNICNVEEIQDGAYPIWRAGLELRQGSGNPP